MDTDPLSVSVIQNTHNANERCPPRAAHARGQRVVARHPLEVVAPARSVPGHRQTALPEPAAKDEAPPPFLSKKSSSLGEQVVASLSSAGEQLSRMLSIRSRKKKFAGAPGAAR